MLNGQFILQSMDLPALVSSATCCSRRPTIVAPSYGELGCICNAKHDETNAQKLFITSVRRMSFSGRVPA
jgi:hypothetical protein